VLQVEVWRGTERDRFCCLKQDSASSQPRLQDHPAKRIDERLPWNWKGERQQKAAA
jgi:hypothetical protein